MFQQHTPPLHRAHQLSYITKINHNLGKIYLDNIILSLHLVLTVYSCKGRLLMDRWWRMCWSQNWRQMSCLRYLYW